jgi:hypothetical protein
MAWIDVKEVRAPLGGWSAADLEGNPSAFQRAALPHRLRAFSNLRRQLGRCGDEPWYRYTFSDTDFAVDVKEGPKENFDPEHRP